MVNEKIMNILHDAYARFRAADFGGFDACMKQIRKNELSTPALCGEYTLIHSFYTLRDTKKTLRNFRRARELLSGYSRIIPRGAPLFSDWYNVFAICNLSPGRADEIANELDEIETLFFSMTKGGAGTAQLYRAQLAFYRGEIDTALALCKKVLKVTRDSCQIHSAICAAELLCNLLKHSPDNKQWESARSFLEQTALGKTSDDISAKEMARTVICTLDLSIGILNVTNQIRSGDFGAISAPWGYRMVGEKMPYSVLPSAMICRTEYFCYSGEYDKALLTAETMTKIYGMGDVLIAAYLFLNCAGCYRCLGDRQAMETCLDNAMALLIPDGILMIAAEFAPFFSDDLYNSAKKIGGEEAARRIRELGEYFWDKIVPLHKATKGKKNSEQLTRREHEVAALAVCDMTYAEIAKELNIGVGTAKTHLLRIYDKLHINRRGKLADALARQKPAAGTAIWLPKTPK